MSVMEQWKDDYLNTIEKDEKKKYAYGNVLTKYIDYLTKEGLSGQPFPTLDKFKEDVRACVRYYVNEGVWATTSMPNLLIEVLKCFYIFLKDNNRTENHFGSFDDSEFKRAIAAENNLPDKEQRGSFTLPEMEKILNSLDEFIETRLCLNGGQDNPYIRAVVIKLFIKLTLLAPAKSGPICRLKLSDFESDSTSMNINKVSVILPKRLQQEIRDAIATRKAISGPPSKEEDSLLRYLSQQKNHTQLNDWLFLVLRDLNIPDLDPGESSLEWIRNTALFALLGNCANTWLISKVGGIKMTDSLAKHYRDIKWDITEKLNKELKKGYFYRTISGEI